jgi:hypothetical protein
VKLHTGFRAAAKAVLAKGPDTAMPALPAAPSARGESNRLARSPLGKRAGQPAKKALPFGGKAAPLFQKKAVQL